MNKHMKSPTDQPTPDPTELATQMLNSPEITLDYNDALGSIRSAWQELSDHYNLEPDEVTGLMIAVDYGLSDFHLQFIANPVYNREQRDELVYGFVDGLTDEQVALYAPYYFQATQMEQLRLGLSNGLSIEQVKTYADPKLSAAQMQTYRTTLETKAVQYPDSADSAISSKQNHPEEHPSPSLEM